MCMKKGDTLMQRGKRILIPVVWVMVILALLLGSGTAGASGNTSGSGSLGPAARPPTGRCPGWHVIPSPSPNPLPASYDILYGVAAVSPTAAWGVGEAAEAALIERWDGREWSLVPNPYPGRTSVLYGVSAVSATDVWAVGTYFATVRSSPALTLHWNGTDWQRVPAVQVGNADTLTGVAAVSASAAWAVGTAYNTNVGPSQTLIERWEGQHWQVVTGPSPGAFYNRLQAVTVIPGTSSLWWTVGADAQSGLGSTETLTELYC
jgi:hypothetical protein